jgi:hypothetical protein
VHHVKVVEVEGEEPYAYVVLEIGWASSEVPTDDEEQEDAVGER